MKHSLRVRALLVVLATLSFVVGANTLMLSWGFVTYEKSSLQQKASLLGEQVRDYAVRLADQGLPAEEMSGVSDTCRSIMDQNDEIGYCMLVGTDGRVLYHNDPLLAGRQLKDSASLKAEGSREKLVQPRTEESVRYYDISLPVIDSKQRLLGSVRVGLRYDSVSSQIYPIIWKSSGAAFVIFLLASVLVNFQVDRKVVAPMEELSNSAALIARGDLSRRIAISSKDEVGQLAASFNSMAEALAEREERIQKGYRELERANSELQTSYTRLETAASELEQKSEHLNETVSEQVFLRDATDRLRASIELDDVLASVARDVVSGLKYERVLVALVNEQARTVEEKVRMGFLESGTEPVREHLDSGGIFAAAISERKVQYVGQAALDPRVSADLSRQLKLAEFAIIPMAGKDRCVGALLVDNRRSSRPMRKDKLDILSTFASTAAMAVENAYLYSQLMANIETVERANRELRALDQTKTHFLSLASHELRTPLVSVMGYLNLMLSGDFGSVTPSQKEMLEIAAKGASRLKDIIEDLLMVTKIEGGRLPLKLGRISLAEVVRASLDEVGPFLRQRRVAISEEGLEHLPKVEADFDRLQQCFTNLIGNAVKFTPDGGRIRVSGRRVWLDRDGVRLNTAPEGDVSSSARGFIEVAVQDTGIGIDKDNLEKIFDKFFEVGDVDSHSTGTVKFLGGGTGLGLSIVRGIVNAHGGSIWAESEGEDVERFPGSRFVMLIPIDQAARVEVSRPPAPAAAVKASVAGDAREGNHKPKVLLIEDDEDTVVVTRMILEKRFAVSVADDGFEGIRKAFTERPDAILLDVWMHGIDGFEVCRILKGNENTRGIPVAMFTASAQEHEMERGYKAGADDYITKPFTSAELTLRVEKLLNSTAGVA